PALKLIAIPAGWSSPQPKHFDQC
ncbi:MAG: hypothetical protein K0Q61_4150, partial [Rhodococcus erythropolis]|nr:hypothetical protein [Rhodococcus erythropolis]